MITFIPIDFQIESLSSCQAPLDHCFFNNYFKLVFREPRRGSGDVAQRLVCLIIKDRVNIVRARKVDVLCRFLLQYVYYDVTDSRWTVYLFVFTDKLSENIWV